MTRDPIAWLYGLQSHGVKLGLDGIRALLGLLHRPDRAFRSVLIGGTNGKGSVSALLDAMLTAGDQRTGLYTSPHLVRANERIRITGTDIGSRQLHRVLDRIREACERGLADGSLAAHPSFFEVMTAAALCAFQSAKVETAVLEVGLGGRLDATNAVEPLVCAIVTVDLDHVGTLGPTHEAIAREKAGIARSGRTLVSGVNHPGAAAVIRDHCAAIGAEFRDARAAELPTAARLGLEGAHQRHNARVALVTFEELARATGRPVASRAIERGLETVRWNGRLQLIPGSPSILLDGAHNPASAEVLGAHLASRPGPKPILLFGAMADKDIPGILRPLAPYVARVVATRPPVLRAAETGDVAAAARALGLPADAASETGAALEKARALAGPGGIVLVAGSLYLVGAVLSVLEGAGAPGPVSM